MYRDLDRYNDLAQIFAYPKFGYREHVEKVEDVLSTHYPGAQKLFKQFSDFISTSDDDLIAEIYTRTFDVQAITTLDIGYVLFGDDYKRGELLVHLNREHRQVNNDCNGELADNLSNLLPLLSKMENNEIQKDLVTEIILPGLIKIIEEFEPKKIELKNKTYKKKHWTLLEQSEDYSKIFLVPLLTIFKIIESDFNFTLTESDTHTNSYANSIIEELKID